MKQTAALYRIAARRSIPVLCFPLPETGSLSIDEGGSCFIGIDETVLDSPCERRVHLAHELGHCLTGSFYNRSSPADLRCRHECRADRWAIRRLIPRRELSRAVADGMTELWELAEHFGVTEPFMRKAVEYYRMLEQS